MKYHTRTLKLKVYLHKENRKETKDRFRQISNDCWKAANYIVTGQYMNEAFIRRMYARRKIDPKDMEAVTKIEKEFFDKTGFFTSKRQATTDRDHRPLFNIPNTVSNTLNRVIFETYRKEKGEVAMGKRSLRIYRQGMPFPTSKSSVVFFEDEDKHGFQWKLGRKEFLYFYIYYGRDKGKYRDTVTKILNGKLDYSAPQFQYKKGAIYLLLPVKDPQIELELDHTLSVGVDLGIAVPAYVALSKGPQRKALGNKNDFLRVRTQFQRRKKDLQKSLRISRGGHGRKVKLTALNRLAAKERNFVKTYNHNISRAVVDFAIKNKAGAIKLEFLKGFSKEEPDGFILRNWSYFELQTMIEYKAKRVGISVVKVDPYHTSQICSECGNYEAGQRISQSEFVCKNCGVVLNADYNAAVNIARSEAIVNRPEQCEYHKLRATG